jgi:Tol biopolymer transport system component
MRMARFAFAIGSVAAIALAAACSSPDTADDSSAAPPDASDGDATGDQFSPPSDAGSGDSATPVDAGACDLTKPFGAPSLIPGVNSPYAQLSPRVSDDELTIYFSSDRSDQGNASDDTDDLLYVATRTSRTDSFTTPIVVTGAANGGCFQPVPSSDQRQLFFTSDQLVGPGGADLFVVSRAVITSPFSAQTQLAGVNTASDEEGPFLRADGQELLFTSDKGGNFDIYRAPLGADGGFGDAVAVTELNTTFSDVVPYLSHDGLTIFFSSNRTGGSGGDDIWTAQRTSLIGNFSAPVNVAELNTAANDDMGSVSVDGCRIYFASSRPTDAGGLQDLYVAERPK